mmetsp:Transcript_36293/g.82725  ORF Transcript_36293/g.82725 Transcript_36293/m.82725 type:complete len:80 (-) Transcript_36293:1254-1493(-)
MTQFKVGKPKMVDAYCNEFLVVAEGQIFQAYSTEGQGGDRGVAAVRVPTATRRAACGAASLSVCSSQRENVSSTKDPAW